MRQDYIRVPDARPTHPKVTKGQCMWANHSICNLGEATATRGYFLCTNIRKLSSHFSPSLPVVPDLNWYRTY